MCVHTRLLLLARREGQLVTTSKCLGIYTSGVAVFKSVPIFGLACSIKLLVNNANGTFSRFWFSSFLSIFLVFKNQQLFSLLLFAVAFSFFVLLILLHC